jgi:hypothetical protein
MDGQQVTAKGITTFNMATPIARVLNLALFVIVLKVLFSTG